MTSLQEPLQSGDRQASRGWHWFGRVDPAVRYTEAWEHETFAEEQARWERSDPQYARICQRVRQARGRGGEVSRCAVEAKAEWDARVATQRQADDDSERAHHALKTGRTVRHRPATSRTPSQRRKARALESSRTPRPVIRARECRHFMRTTFAIESNDSPAPGIMPEPVRVHDQPAAKTVWRAAGRATPSWWRSARNPGQQRPTKLEVK